MYDYTSQAGLLIQGFLVAILIGVFYNLWVSTKVYGGIIGLAVRLFGIGMLFITLSLIERVLINFGIIQSTPDLAMVQDIMSLIGLVFLGLGFSKLASGAKV